MVGGKCYGSLSHKFYRYKYVKCREGIRTISVKVGLTEPQDSDFCINCGLLRRNIKPKVKKKQKKRV